MVLMPSFKFYEIDATTSLNTKPIYLPRVIEFPVARTGHSPPDHCFNCREAKTKAMSSRTTPPSTSGDTPVGRGYIPTSGAQHLPETYGFTNRPFTSFDPFAGRPAKHQSMMQSDPRIFDAPSSQPGQRFMMPTSRELSSSILPPIEAGRSIPIAHHSATFPQNISITSVGYARSEDRRRSSQESYYHEPESPSRHSYTDFEYETSTSKASAGSRAPPRYHSRRKIYNQDEFDGPSQLLGPPSPRSIASRERRLPELPMNLTLQEQDEIMTHLNDILSECAFHFIAKYSFPIPLDRDKPQVQGPGDREWTEWAYLLKKLATKRRIPARFLFDNQIKQFVTIVENALGVRRPSVSREQGPVQGQIGLLRDDRLVLQQISAGTQFAKIVMDATAMEQLDELYAQTEHTMLDRRAQAAAAAAAGARAVHFLR